MKLSAPEFEVLRFASEDVIATSGLLPANVTGLFYIPTSQFNGGSYGDAGYLSFNGTGGTFNSAAGGYLITGVNTIKTDVGGERDELMTKGGELAAFIPASFFEDLAQKTFDAYSYNGDYYTNGVSYYNMYYTN